MAAGLGITYKIVRYLRFKTQGGLACCVRNLFEKRDIMSDRSYIRVIPLVGAG